MALPSVQELLEQDLFTLLGIEGADEAKKAEVLASMTKLVESRIISRLATQLNEADAAEFNRLAEAGDSDALVAFLVKKEIDLPLVVSEETTRVRVEFAELMQLAQEK